jgi:hypothetical protein
MPKQPVSVTLDAANLTWLRGRVGAGAARNLSDLIDQIIREARTAGGTTAARSVIGSIDLDPNDPDLEAADEDVRSLFAKSLARPFMVRERASTPAATRATRPPRRRRG